MLQKNNEVLVNIDDVGRMVIPKKFRDILGINPNSFINMSVIDGYIKITNNGIKDYLILLENIFILSWLSAYPLHSIIIIQNNIIKEVYGNKKAVYKNNTINEKLLNDIKDPYFTYKKYSNYNLFISKELFDFKIMNLTLTQKSIGHMIIIDNFDICENQLYFIFNFVRALLNNSITNPN